MALRSSARMVSPTGHTFLASFARHGDLKVAATFAALAMGDLKVATTRMVCIGYNVLL